MQDKLKVKGARVHNLKNVDLTIPRNKLVVFTGLSGSGKSSLAFDTIYAEGQRRYVESLSAYARQFLEQMEKPDVDHIEGLSPAISIDQKTTSHNPRSTVGTITEIYDYLRLLFANIGLPHCPTCGKPVQKQSAQEICYHVGEWPKGSKITILAPIIQGKKGEYRQVFGDLQGQGFSRVRVDGEIKRLSDPISLDKNFKHTIEIVIDRLTVGESDKARLFESVETALKAAHGLVQVESDAGKSQLFSELMGCATCGTSIPELTPRLFSFNSPYGACGTCNGLGEKFDFDPDYIIEDPDTPLYRATQKSLNLADTYYGRRAAKAGKVFGFSMTQSFNSLSAEQKHIFLYGDQNVDKKPEDITTDDFLNVEADYWEGVIGNLRRRYYQTQSEGMRMFFRTFMSAKPCPVCHGSRLKPEALSVKVSKKSISDLCGLSIEQLQPWIEGLKLTQKETEIAKQILKEIRERLSFLNHVGLTYISLNRRAGTLSGGELQRIRLATQIGSGLTGVLYVLDEPSIGLHQRDNRRLIQTLMKLRDLGNTLIVVEHDEDMIRLADHVVDIGPAAGRDGGQIVFSGGFKDLLKHPTSTTAKFLNGEEKIEVPKKRREPSQKREIVIRGAKENNLKDIDVAFPLGKLVAVTGVSGSGKSTLIHDILHNALMKHFFKSKEQVGKHKRIEGLEHIDKMITIDQSPIGRTPRSNPATYTGLFAPIRDLFTETREAKIRGYKAGRFSFNVKGGRCESCEGDGVVKIEMHFLSDVYVTCEVCKGKRYNEQTLEVTFKGFSINDVLEMTVAQAAEVFANIPSIANTLQTLIDVGLSYVKLGQNATTLSGGEAQRIKLAKELCKRSTGKTLYLLDEPTTGLHFADIKKLLGVLNRLVEGGNTVIVIEHNLDVIKTADHLIDLGPEGGDKGGNLVAEGTPETVAANPNSYTGQFLREVLGNVSVPPKKVVKRSKAI